VPSLRAREGNTHWEKLAFNHVSRNPHCLFTRAEVPCLTRSVLRRAISGLICCPRPRALDGFHLRISHLRVLRHVCRRSIPWCSRSPSERGWLTTQWLSCSREQCPSSAQRWELLLPVGPEKCALLSAYECSADDALTPRTAPIQRPVRMFCITVLAHDGTGLLGSPTWRCCDRNSPVVPPLNVSLPASDCPTPRVGRC